MTTIRSDSRMCTAGRIKHHLHHNIARPESTILFVGFQAAGTLGRQILNGQRIVRIHGSRYPVRARIEQIHGFSAHAGLDDLLRWLGHLKRPPRHLFLTYGEKEAAEALCRSIKSTLGWQAVVPEYGQAVDLDP